MGQMALGILYGSESPELPDAPDGQHEAVYHLINRWEKAIKRSWSDGGPEIRCESEGGKQLVGVWVAVSGSGEDDAPYLVDQAMPLDSIEDAFGKQIKIAKKLWDKFSAWVAKNESITMTTPTLWLTPCEVA